MQELRKEVLKALKDISDAYTNEARKAKEDQRYVDLSETSSKFADTMTNLMIKFDEAEVRIKNKKKGFFK